MKVEHCTFKYTFNMTMKKRKIVKDFIITIKRSDFLDKKSRSAIWKELDDLISNYDFTGKAITSVSTNDDLSHYVDNIKSVNIIAALFFSENDDLERKRSISKIINLLSSRKPIFNQSLLMCAARSDQSFLSHSIMLISKRVHDGMITDSNEQGLDKSSSVAILAIALGLFQKEILKTSATIHLKKTFLLINDCSRVNPAIHANTFLKIMRALYQKDKDLSVIIFDNIYSELMRQRESTPASYALNSIRVCLQLLDVKDFLTPIELAIKNSEPGGGNYNIIRFLSPAFDYRFNSFNNYSSRIDNYINEIFEITGDVSLLGLMSNQQKRRSVSQSLGL